MRPHHARPAGAPLLALLPLLAALVAVPSCAAGTVQIPVGSADVGLVAARGARALVVTTSGMAYTSSRCGLDGWRFRGALAVGVERASFRGGRWLVIGRSGTTFVPTRGSLVRLPAATVLGPGEQILAASEDGLVVIRDDASRTIRLGRARSDGAVARGRLLPVAHPERVSSGVTVARVAGVGAVVSISQGSAIERYVVSRDGVETWLSEGMSGLEATLPQPGRSVVAEVAAHDLWLVDMATHEARAVRPRNPTVEDWPVALAWMHGVAWSFGDAMLRSDTGETVFYDRADDPVGGDAQPVAASAARCGRDVLVGTSLGLYAWSGDAHISRRSRGLEPTLLWASVDDWLAPAVALQRGAHAGYLRWTRLRDHRWTADAQELSLVTPDGLGACGVDVAYYPDGTRPFSWADCVGVSTLPSAVAPSEIAPDGFAVTTGAATATSRGLWLTR